MKAEFERLITNLYESGDITDYALTCFEGYSFRYLLNSEHRSEAQNVMENEQSVNVCDCAQSECTLINGTYICSTCNRPVVQTC